MVQIFASAASIKLPGTEPKAFNGTDISRTLTALLWLLQDNWTKFVCPHIMDRIARYSQNEIRFNLLAIVRDRTEVLQEQLRALDAAAGGASSSDHESSDAGGNDVMRDGEGFEPARLE